jgi:hypothetical protein
VPIKHKILTAHQLRSIIAKTVIHKAVQQIPTATSHFTFSAHF